MRGNITRRRPSSAYGDSGLARMRVIWSSQHGTATSGRRVRSRKSSRAKPLPPAWRMSPFRACGIPKSRICSGAVSRCTSSRPCLSREFVVTLNIYAHMLPGQQEGAAAVVDAALTAALQE
jgi:hypothetical protein